MKIMKDKERERERELQVTRFRPTLIISAVLTNNA